MVDTASDYENNVPEEVETTPASEVKSDSLGNSNRNKKEKHIYKNRGFYAFRYVAMLLSGAGFLSCLISVLSITISKLVNGDDF
ncbi:hypothetical protein IKW75_01695, partial [Candidatus Saccharibacteria bacterium]|nr:hypothetical protein [Candidatus Saccharibacteria bacterium]